MSKQPHPHLLQAQYALALLLSKVVGRPGTEPPEPPPSRLWRLSLSLSFPL